MRASTALFNSFIALCSAATLSGAQQAAANRDAMLVSPVWLAAHLHDANLVVLHVGDRADYASTHIPGARYVDLDDISVSDHSAMNGGAPAGNGLTLEMLPADQLRAKLASLGISDNSHVVVYFAKDRVSPSTRVVFTLDYAGLGKRTALLDGGLDAWMRGGRPVTDVVPAAHTGTLAALELAPIVVNAEYVHARAARPGVSIVDARAAAFYDGVPRGGPNRLGHIPGAKSIPYTEVTDAALQLKTADQLATLFSKAGVQPGDTVVAYCHIGQQATALLFAARSLGHPVLLYDGSFEDWSRHAEYPVENPSAKGKP
ncbi:MAG: Rhodanese-like protein [Gemmatimonadetes bacterium]|nr:Rhodanese-like protein [Gemmatimonadota bacterium]